MIWNRENLITLDFGDGNTCDVRVKVPTFEDVQKFVQEQWPKIQVFKYFVIEVEGLSAEEIKNIENVPGAFVLINPVSDYIVESMALSPSLKKK